MSVQGRVSKPVGCPATATQPRQSEVGDVIYKWTLKSVFAAFPDFQSTLQQLYSSTFQPESVSPAWQTTQSAAGSPLCTGKLDFNVPDDVTFPADKIVNL